MRWRCLVTLTLLLHATASGAAQLSPVLDDGQLAVRIESTAWPETLAKDLTSGLTNRILIRVSLKRDTQIVQQRAVEVAIRYDLWDERFEVNLTIEDADMRPDAFKSRLDMSSRIIRSLDEMQATLRTLHLPRLFPTTTMTAAQLYTVTTEILLNPVDHERMEMIRKWVAENSIAAADIGRPGSGSGLSTSIFNRIFEQYAKGADIAAAWQETSTSLPFKLEDLSE